MPKKCLAIHRTEPSHLHRNQRSRTLPVACPWQLLAVLLALLNPALPAQPLQAAEWEVPRLANGKPNLQGVWSNVTRTPLQRRAALGNQRAYSDQQAEQLAAQILQREAAAAGPSAADRGAPTGENIGSYNTFWLERGDELTVIDGEVRTSLIVDPADGRIPWLPESERAPNQLARWLAQPGVGPFDGPELQTIGERCLLFFDYRSSESSAGPPMMPMYYNSNYQIIQTDDYVVIVAEMINDARIIRLEDDHQDPALRRWMGDSVGQWQGDTLVVTTRHFHPQQSHFGASPNVVVTERFSRSSATQIEYSFTMDDPAVYAQPWTAEMTMQSLAGDARLFEYACHEGNYALTGILAGARRAEVEGE